MPVVRRDRGAGAWRCLLCSLVLVLGMTTANAQTTAVCSNTPDTGDRIECTQDSTSTSDIEIVTENLTISTTGINEPGIKATHAGGGNITITSDSDSITTTGASGSAGIAAIHSGSTGNITVTTDGTTILSSDSAGIRVSTSTPGSLDVDITGGSITTANDTAAQTSHGVSLYQTYGGSTVSGPVTLDIDGLASITTSGNNSSGVDIYRLRSDGQNKTTISNTTISTMGTNSHGISVQQLYNGSQTEVGNLEINLDGGVEITTAGTNAAGIRSSHENESATLMGDINLTIHGNNTITTTGNNSNAIWSLYKGDSKGQGDIVQDVEGATFTTTGDNSVGIRSDHRGIGDIKVTVKDSAVLTEKEQEMTDDTFAFGIYAEHRGTGDIDIDYLSGSIETRGMSSYGIYGLLRDTASGHILIETGNGSTITTKGRDSPGILAYNLGTGQGNATINITGSTITTNYGNGVFASRRNGTGDIIINVQGGTITTKKGFSTDVILGRHSSEGDIRIDVRDAAIISENTELHPTYMDTFNPGIHGRHRKTGLQDNTGNVHIGLRGSASVRTMGPFSYGIFGENYGQTQAITIDTDPGTSITTIGANGHGIVAYHRGLSDTRTMDITVGGTIDVSGANSQAVRVGAVIGDGPARMGSIDDEGYRHQTVTVDGVITSAAEGVFLTNGGRVIIGPQGSIDSSSGIAILATGTVPEVPAVEEDATDPDNVIPAIPAIPPIPPKLRVDLNPGGRRVSQVLGDNWIINDGGVTTIAVNDTVLHDGVMGVTTNTAHNGVWDVTMREHGVMVTDRTATDPSDWVTTESTATDPIIANRDFSSADFTEMQARCPPGQIGTPPNCMDPPPPMCPVGKIGTPPNCMDPPPPMCPDGQIGIYPDCMDPPPPMCPDGQIGIYPDCSDPPPPMCPDGQIGTYPDCMVPPSPMCPAGQIGTPPNCEAPPVDMCPEGQIGTPPNCVTPPVDMCPAGQVGTPPDCSVPEEPEPEPEPEPEMPMFMEEYAPRAALYEALPAVLPDFLLHMNNWDQASQRLFLPESPVWIRLLESTGSQEFKRSTVNANYDADRFAVEVGVNIPLREDFNIWASAHHVTGSAEVSSPVNGGDIDVTGVGLSLDAYWSGENDYYATGRLSLTDYDLDLSSNTIGRLKSNGDANGRSLYVEAGRRMTLSENRHWTPRVWLGHTRVSIDPFTDAVDSRVSFPNTDRFTGGIGVMAETVRAEYGGGELLLRGSLDFEQKLGDLETVALVSGERLSAEPEKRSALMSLGGVWQKGSFTYSAGLSARQELNSGGKDYSGVIQVGMRF